MVNINYDLGPLGWLFTAVLIGAGIIVAIFLFSAAKVARDTVVEEEQDKGHDAPIA